MVSEVREAMEQVYSLRRELAAGYLAVRSPVDCLPILDRYAKKEQEHFIVVAMNGAQRIVSHKVVTVGLVNRTVVHPREVFRWAIKENACSVVVAHNHPSGELEPSKEDISITKRLVEAGNVLGIKVLDHIIFSTSGFYSFLEHDRL